MVHVENSDLPHPAAGRLPTTAHSLDAKMNVFRREKRDQVWQALRPRQAVREVLTQNVWGGITGFLLSGKDAPVLLHPSSHQGHEDKELTAQLPGRKMRLQWDPVPGLWPRPFDHERHSSRLLPPPQLCILTGKQQ